MTAHFVHFLISELAGLVDDIDVNADLPEIMQEKSGAQRMNVMIFSVLKKRFGQCPPPGRPR